jgi:cephalosporin hydroxylase
MESLHTLLTTSTAYERIPDVIKRMKGKTFHHHFFVLWELRTLLGEGKKTYTEIGTYHGGSLSFMLEHPFDTEYVSIDPCHQGSEHYISENIKTFNKFDRKVTHHKKFSFDTDLIQSLRDSGFKTDILFIDGDHRKEYLYKDFYLYQEFVNPGGYIVFDDYNDPDSPDVKPVVDDLKEKGHFNGYIDYGFVKNVQKVHPVEFELNNEYIIQRQI